LSKQRVRNVFITLEKLTISAAKAAAKMNILPAALGAPDAQGGAEYRSMFLSFEIEKLKVKLIIIYINLNNDSENHCCSCLRPSLLIIGPRS
jgi:hypothetical protein